MTEVCHSSASHQKTSPKMPSLMLFFTVNTVASNVIKSLVDSHFHLKLQ